MRFTQTSTERPSQSAVLRLWEEHRATGEPRLRDRLVLTFAPLVKYLAYRRVRTLPAHVLVEDMISCGLEALIRSLDRYDPAKGASLERFLWTRIEGSMTDELRRQDAAPRSLRRAQREVGLAWSQFQATNGRPPTNVELGARVGMSAAELHAHRTDLHAMDSVGSLNESVNDADRATAERGELLVSRDDGPEEAAFEEVDSQALAAALAALSGRERTVIGLVYFHELTLAEIGKILGVSESRVCQINSQARARLREHLTSEELVLAG